MTGPYEKLVEDIANRVVAGIRDRLGCNLSVEDVVGVMEEPPRKEFGDLAIPAPRLLKKCRAKFQDLAGCIASSVKNSVYVEKVNVTGPYINMFIDMKAYGRVVIENLRDRGESYGFSNNGGDRVVVEFVSANPVHPLHIGSGRNAALGDFIARVLELNGSKVERRYYIDDLGLQVAYLAYGYKLLDMPEPPRSMKVDHFMGLIYAAAATLTEIISVKEELESARKANDTVRYKELNSKLSELLADLERIRSKLPEYIDKLIVKIKERRDPKAEVYDIMRKYESGDPDTVELVKSAVEKVMTGIQQTLRDLGVMIDKWDWESDLIRENLVSEVLNKALKSPYITLEKGVPALDFSQLLKNSKLREKLDLPKYIDIPPLVLIRSDGTTLYTTRDIAYTVKKFREFNADRVINVIAVEQVIPQAQLKLALYLLGYKKEASNLVHYAYELVTLPGTSMSGRKGTYVTIDEVLSELKAVARKLMTERGVEPKDEILLKIARSALKYLMLSTSPSKPIVFDLARAMNIKANSAPYLMYTYARASSVLSRCDNKVGWDKVDFSGCTEGLRRDLIWLIGKFPHVMKYVLKYLRPEDLATYLNMVADVFNSWYDRERILDDGREGLRHLKLAITFGVKTVMRNGLTVMGLDVLERI